MAPFDYHAELDVEPTATREEIRQAYFRLALIHHPDKNPDNVAAATAKFQRLQTAYEALTKPSTRRQTGAAPASHSHAHSHAHAHAHRHYPNQHNDSDSNSDYYDDFQDYEDYYGFWSDEDDEPYFDIPRYHSYGGGGGSYHSFAFYEQLFERYTQERSARAAAAMRETQARHRYEEQQRQAKKAAKKAAEEVERNAEEELRAAALAEERALQNDIWSKAGAVTKDEKLRACLHSSFCRTGRQEKKTKCSSCKKVAGLRPFECPHCASFLCHQCQVRFARRREKAAVSQPESPITSEPDTAQGVEEVEIGIDTEPAENGRVSPAPDEAAACLPHRNVPSSPRIIAKPEQRPEYAARSSSYHSNHPEPPPKTEAKSKSAAPVAQTIDEICLSAGIRVARKNEVQAESDEMLARRLQEDWNEQERRTTQARWHEERRRENDTASQSSKKPKQPPKQKTFEPQKGESNDAPQSVKRGLKQYRQMHETRYSAEASEKLMKDTLEPDKPSGSVSKSKALPKQASESEETRAAIQTPDRFTQNSSQGKKTIASGLPSTKPLTRKKPLNDVSTTTQLQPNGNRACQSSVGTSDSQESVNHTRVHEYTHKEKKGNPKKSRCSRCKRFGHFEDTCWFAHPELKTAAGKNTSKVKDSQMAEPGEVTEPSLSTKAHHAPQSTRVTDSGSSLNSEFIVQPSKSGADNHSAATKPRCAHCKRSGHVKSECWVIHPKVKEMSSAPSTHIKSESKRQSVGPKTSMDIKHTEKEDIKNKYCVGCKRQGHLESRCWVTHPELRQAGRSKSSASPATQPTSLANPVVLSGSATDQVRKHDLASATLVASRRSTKVEDLQPQQVPAKPEDFMQHFTTEDASSSSKFVSRISNATRMSPLKKMANLNKSGQQSSSQPKSDLPKTVDNQQRPKQKQSPKPNTHDASEAAGFSVCLKLDTDTRTTSLLAFENALTTSFGSLSLLRTFRPKAGILHAEFADRDSQVKALKAGTLFVGSVNMRIERWRG